MNFLGSIFGGLTFWPFSGKGKRGVKQSFGKEPYNLPEFNGVSGIPEKVATVFSCCRILSENLSRMPISVFKDDGKTASEQRNHRLVYLLKYKPNNYQSAQKFWSTIEYHRNKYGNGLARIHRNYYSGLEESLEIIHPYLVKEYFFENGMLFYVIGSYVSQDEETINADDLLHFTGISEDGIVGITPIEAIKRQMNINERSTLTMDNFYKNGAISPHAITSDFPSNDINGPAKAMVEASIKNFEEQNAGPLNAGKPIRLPFGFKIQNMPIQFADAQLIETLKFTREDISSAYGVPLFMVDGTAEKLDVEQLTTLFQNNTMGPIVAIYIAELNSKLMSRSDLMNGFTVSFDVSELIGMAYQAKVNSIVNQVKNMVMTPNEAARKLRTSPIEGEYGNYHFTQAQNIPLEKYDQFSVLKKDDPTLKTK